MSHAHSHGEGEGNYFLDQLFTILACGAIGLVAVLMYQTEMLGRILAPFFFTPVMIGGAALLFMVVIRAIALWKMAGKAAPVEEHVHDESCGHDHSHGHEHSHSHGHEHSHSHGHEHSHAHAAATDDCCNHTSDCGHDHSPDDPHDHGWAPWRYMVLAIPVFLYFLDLPRSEGFSQDRINQSISRGTLQDSSKRASLALLAGGPAYRKTNARELHLGFKELVEASAILSYHERYEGDIGIIRGRFLPINGNDREFSLYREDMTCCRADAVFLETRILVPESVQSAGYKFGEWVQVQGIISFQRDEAKKKWVPVITLSSLNDIKPTESTPDLNTF